MRLTKLLLYATILSIPLGQLGKIPIGGSEINIYLTDILVGSLVFIWLGHTLAVKKTLKLPPLTAPILLFSGIAFVSLINSRRWLSGDQLLVSGSYLVRWVMYAGVYFVALDLGKRFAVNDLRVAKTLILSGVLLAAAGFIQLLIFPDFSTMAQTEGWDPHKNRLLSTFFDPNFTGAYLVLTLCLILPNLSPLTLLTTAALVLTFSRSAWLMFAVVVAVIGLLKSKNLLVLALVFGLAAYLLVPRVQTRIAGGVDPDDSARARLKNWQQTTEIAKNNWLIGVGFNAFRYAQARQGLFPWQEPLGGRAGAGSDSSLLLVLATTGILGLLAFLLIWLTALFKPPALSLKLPLLAALAGLLVESNFINSLFYPPIMLWLWLIAGTGGRNER